MLAMASLVASSVSQLTMMVSAKMVGMRSASSERAVRGVFMVEIVCDDGTRCAIVD